MADVSAVAQIETDKIELQAPANILKIDDPPNFQTHVGNGQSEKPTATATFEPDIGGDRFAEHFVVLKNFTRPFINLHLMRHNSADIGTTNMTSVNFTTWQRKS